MADGKPSLLVLIVLALIHLVAFGFAIAAERRRSIGKVVPDSTPGMTYCSYNSDVATGYGVGAFLFLFLGQCVLMAVTKCLCRGGSLMPGGARAWAIIYFISSWLTFLIAEACLLAGSVRNAYHTKYRGYIGSFSCETLRKGVFAAGAAFIIFTLVLGSMYYTNYCKARDGVRKQFRGSAPPPPAGKANIGMASYS